MSEFDPLGILGALERHRVAYVVIGDLAGVLHGSDLSANTVEIVPSLKTENIERLDRALSDLTVATSRRAVLQDISRTSPPITIRTGKGKLTLTPAPPGTRGYADLLRAAQREPPGAGVRVPVASAPDLIRSLASGQHSTVLEQRLRRIGDLERGVAREM